jgi:hypothetical protein
MVLFAAVAAAGPAFSSVEHPPGSRMIAFFPVRDYSRGLDATAIQPVESLRDVRSEDIALIIPADLRPTSNGGTIAAQILDHSLSSFFNSSAVKHSDLGRTAHQVEKKMEGEASFGGNAEGSVKHNFKFGMKAAQAKAQLEYTGITNAQLSYQLAQSTMNFEVSEKLAPTTRLVFNHIAKPGDITDMVSMRWVW